jgi:2-methylcitrate dehydratase PrpD
VLYPKGEPENPLSDDEMASKFEKNASTLYALDRVHRIRDNIMTIENRNVRELTSILKAP